jgi:hypothetical protein
VPIPPPATVTEGLPLQLTRRRKLAAAATAAGAAGTVALAFAIPAFGTDLAAFDLDRVIVPTTAEAFADQDCAAVPADADTRLDTWVFALPGSGPSRGEFAYVKATFRDEDGNVLRYDTEEHGGTGGGLAFISAPADLELIDAEAQVAIERRDSAPLRFHLASTCPAVEAGPDS